MYIVTLQRGYTEFEFKFGTWAGASEFMMIALKSAKDINGVSIEVSVRKEEE